MKLTTKFAALVVAVGLSACATTDSISDANSRSTLGTSSQVEQELAASSAAWRLADVRVRVSDDLIVSEENLYYPKGDIVWRGDPYGDRRVQVAKILDDGMTSGLTHLIGKRRVFFDVDLHRFHSLTEKARYSVGGVHNIEITLTVVDAATGVVLHSPFDMEIDLKAHGGEKAIIAEQKGLTQKVRIKAHLAKVMRETFPGK